MIGIAQLQGHWRRDWIRAPGFEDATTRVHWMQAGDLFADLRIPLARPDPAGRGCLADLSQPELAQLLTAEGFAGHISVRDDTCIWHRELNWHGAPTATDTGRMSFQDGALIEDGVLAEYRERWVPEQEGALRGHRIMVGDQIGVLIEDDAVFLVGIGPVPVGSSAGLIAALQAGTASEDGLRMQFASTYCIGTWDGDAGIASLSTNPFCEGEVVLRRGAAFSWHAPSFCGTPAAALLQAA